VSPGPRSGPAGRGDPRAQHPQERAIALRGGSSASRAVPRRPSARRGADDDLRGLDEVIAGAGEATPARLARGGLAGV